MDISQDRIDALVARPSEGLNVELKQWIDPSDIKGIAKIALACIALRNRNGGYLVIGIKNDTLKPDLENIPDDVRKAFNVDLIQGIVSKYASTPFEVQIGFAAIDNHEFPVIAVPQGTTVPVATKSDLPDPKDKHKFLIRADTVYFRTLGSNGTPSTSAAKASDWREIVEICFENREGDIGRFLRRHLGADNLARFVDAAQQVVTPSPPKQTASDLARIVEFRGAKARDEAILEYNLSERDRELIKSGSWSVALAFDPPLPATDATPEFLQTLAGSNPQYTGWPVWLDSRSFSEEAARPYKKQKGYEALIISTAFDRVSSHIDFMRMETQGNFYLWRNLQDDTTDRVEPRTALDPALMVYRVAEAMAVGHSFAKALGCGEDTVLGYCFKWNGIKGRVALSWANPMIYFSSRAKARDNEISTCVEVPFTTPVNSIAPYVAQAVAELFAAFDGFVYPREGIEQRVEKLLSRTW